MRASTIITITNMLNQQIADTEKRFEDAKKRYEEDDRKFYYEHCRTLSDREIFNLSLELDKEYKNLGHELTSLKKALADWEEHSFN